MKNHWFPGYPAIFYPAISDWGWIKQSWLIGHNGITDTNEETSCHGWFGVWFVFVLMLEHILGNIPHEIIIFLWIKFATTNIYQTKKTYTLHETDTTSPLKNGGKGRPSGFQNWDCLPILTGGFWSKTTGGVDDFDDLFDLVCTLQTVGPNGWSKLRAGNCT